MVIISVMVIIYNIKIFVHIKHIVIYNIETTTDDAISSITGGNSAYF